MSSLSNRFSVLKEGDDTSLDGQARKSATANTSGYSLAEMRERFARQRLSGNENYLTEEEEAAVLQELEQDLKRAKRSPSLAASPKRSPKSSDSQNKSNAHPIAHRSTSRTYGIGSSGSMREAELLRKAERSKTDDRSPQSASLSPQSPKSAIRTDSARSSTFEAPFRNASSAKWSPPSTGHLAERKRSVLETLQPAAQQRVSRALLQIEADIAKDRGKDTKEVLEDSKADSTNPHTPLKKSSHQRRKPSISRSPAFHDNLAEVVVVDKSNDSVSSSTMSKSGPELSPAAIEDVFGDMPAETSFEQPPSSPTNPARRHMRKKSTRLSAPNSPSKRLPIPEHKNDVALQPIPSPQDVTFDVTGYYGYGNADSDDDHVKPAVIPVAETESHGNPAPSSLGSRYSDYQQGGSTHFSPVGSMFPLHDEDIPLHQSPTRQDPIDQEPEKELGLSLDDLQQMQDQLIDAARSIRIKMNQGQAAPRSVSSSSQPSVTSDRSALRARPSIVRRNISTTYDAESGLDELARALSPEPMPEPPAPAPVAPVTSAASELKSPVILGPPLKVEHQPVQSVPELPVSSPAAEPKHLPELEHTISPAPALIGPSDSSQGRSSEDVILNTPRQFSPTPHSPTTDPQESAKSRLAQALFGPTDPTSPPSPVEPTISTHRRMQSASSARSYRIDEDPDVRRDFETRIAQATAALQKQPSVKVLRKTTLRNKAIKIGSPTLLQTSATLQVSPLTSPQVAQNGFPSPDVTPVPRTPQQASRSNGSPTIPPLRKYDPSTKSTKDASSGSSGLKGLFAKLKRTPSRKQSTGSRSRSGGGSFSSPKEPVPRPPSRPMPGTLVAGSDQTHTSGPTSSVPVTDLAKERKSIVRRTIIVPTSSFTNEPIPEPTVASNDNGSAPGESTPERKTSIKRKPVVRTSADNNALAQTFLAPPSGPADARSQRSGDSGRDSLYDLYAEESSSSLGPKHSRDESSNRSILSTAQQALEIREMSDGQVVWGLVDEINEHAEETLVVQADDDDYHEHGRPRDMYDSNVGRTSGQISRQSEDAWEAAERELLEDERPQTKVICSSLSCSCILATMAHTRCGSGLLLFV